MGRATMSYLIKTVQPTSEPVTLAEAQLHLRLDTVGSPASHPDDSLVQVLISASRESAENYINSTIAECGYTLKAEAEDLEISLQTYPVTAIASVTYQDAAGDVQTVLATDYYVDNYARPSRLVFKETAPAYEVTVSFTAGYNNEFVCPASVKAAILLMLGNWYENRESVSNMQSYQRPQSATYLLTPYRIDMGT